MNKNQYPSWTEQEVSQLQALAAEGHSASEIAAKMNRRRGSICTKANRLGLRLCGGAHWWNMRKKYR